MTVRLMAILKMTEGRGQFPEFSYYERRAGKHLSRLRELTASMPPISLAPGLGKECREHPFE